MRSNRVHVAPPIIEDLGDGRSYYQFNVIETTKDEGGAEPFLNFDYDEVAVENPATEEKIITAMEEAGFVNDDNRLDIIQMVEQDVEAYL